MPIAFDDIRLPANIEEGAQWRLSTMTHRVRGFGGREVRYAKQRPLWRAALTVLPEDAGEMIGIIYRQIGPRYAFLARCHPHYSTWDVPNVNTLLTKRVADGKWPLTIDYGDISRSAVRRIIAPIVDAEFKIFKDGLEVDSNLYTVSAGGLVEPVTSPAQGWDEADIDWVGTFDVPCNIDSDESAISALTNGNRTVVLNLSEVPFDLSDV